MRLKKPAVSAIIILVALVTMIGLSGLNFLIPKNSDTEPRDSGIRSSEAEKMDKIFLTTEDGVKIAADLYEVDSPRLWAVLVHMMPATKESYQELARKFQGLGYESIAIDLRGHGESDGGPDGYRDFSDQQHQKSALDLEAAADYLAKNRKATSDKIFFVGASIGANLSLRCVSEHPEFPTAVLLSAGSNYHGIKTEPLVENLKTGQKVFFVSGKDDGNNAEENRTLYDLMPAGTQKKIQVYENGGHGTDILKNRPDLTELIIGFIKNL